jgi:hypothetical protein
MPRGATRLKACVADALVRVWRRIRPVAPEPCGPPIEDIAASLRRLQSWLDAYDHSRPIPGKATKVAAASLAYDQVLIEACRALDIPQALAATRGMDREAERMTMQVALEDAGLVLRQRWQAGR